MPNSPDIAKKAAELHALAFEYQQQGNSGETISCLTQLIELVPEDAAAHANLGLMYHTEGDAQQAISFYQQAIDRDPSQQHVYFLLGTALQEVGHLDESSAALQEALNLKGDDINTMHLLGHIYTQKKMPTDAARIYRNILTQDPKNFQAHYNLGLLFLEEGKYQKAADCFTKTLQVQPDDCDSMFNLAFAYQRLGKAAAAAEYYEKVLEATPDDSDILFNLGSLYKDLHNLDKSITCFKQIIAMHPDHGAAFSNLGNLYHMQGRVDKAISCYQKALELNHHADAARHLIASLEGEPADSMPSQYITDIFDDYATRFDHSLVQELEYRVPGLLRELLDTFESDPTVLFANAIDLGCGTGLAGEAFHPRAPRITGVDLSEKMLSQSAAKKIYESLHHADLNAFLKNTTARYDLFIAADVFTYIGELSSLFAAIANVAQPGALLLFSTEHNEGDGEYVLRQTGRFAHTPSYITSLSKASGFTVLRSQPANLRKDKNAWIQGDIYLLQADADT